MVPHSRPTLGEEETDAVASVVRSGQLVDGPETAAFERAVADVTNTEWGISCTSGTSALHLALLGLGIKAGDYVAVPSYVCVALVHAVRYVGAQPFLVDVDPETYNMDPDALKRNAPAGLRAAIVPHMFGLPAPVADVMSLGVPVIEDCALAIGASTHGHFVGSQGELAICSFYATKMLATGEGGMVVGHDAAVGERIRDLRDYDQPDGHTTRYNYKMTEIQAAMGMVQLRRLPDFINRRREIARCYSRDLQDLDMDLPVDRPAGTHIFYRYVTRMRRPLEEIIAGLDRAGIACRRPVSMPLHQLLEQPSLPAADAAFASALSIPIYPSLSEEEYASVIEALHLVI